LQPAGLVSKASHQGHGVNPPRDLVAGNPRILQPRPVALLNQQVAVANTTSFDFDPNLPASGFRHWALNDLEISAWLADLNNFHEPSRNNCPPRSHRATEKYPENSLWLGTSVVNRSSDKEIKIMQHAVLGAQRSRNFRLAC